MLKNHLQPVLAYFFNQTDRSTDRPGLPFNNPLQPMVDYWSEPAVQDDRSSAASKAVQTLGYLWKQLTTASTEPQIRQHIHQNQPYWQVYDPVTDRHHTFTSEEAVYRWLEHRYSE